MHGPPSGEIPVVPHVGWSNLYLEELLPKLLIPPVDVCSSEGRQKHPEKRMPTTRSTTGASAWKCHRCNHANNTVRNKKRCSSCPCRSWKDGIALLSASARGVVLDNKAGVELRDDVSAGIDIFEDARENDSPNTKNALCHMVGTTSGHESTDNMRGPERGESLPSKASMADHHFLQYWPHRHRLACRLINMSRQTCNCCNVVASTRAVLGQRLPLLQSHCNTLQIN
jgi:hypothetical protein